ncbi:MAG: serine/threonine protein kinase [Gammaproteobacteria bacterium]|nr:serine/threonine protein kinase [Gammaproteobacteria bacterium]
MFSFKSRAWQLGLTSILWGFTFLLSLTSTVSNFEYDLFLHIVALQPADRELVAIQSIQHAPQWILLLVYGLVLAVYVRCYTRSRTNVISILTVILILFGLLMLEVMLAVFFQRFLPVMFPALVMLLVSIFYWMIDLYQGMAMSILVERNAVSLADVRARIESEDYRTALTMLKQCPYSDDMLEVGYELGMLLESGKHWASALNLYHWLSKYDPGLGDFVARIEEIHRNRTILLKLGKSLPIAEPELPMIGNYRLLRKIAKGSTSVMYEATDQRSHNRVALKVMRVHKEEKLERDRARHWLHEAVIVSQLEHRNIVKIHDAEMLGDNAYIAMDYISGYSMSSRLRRREYLTVEECIRVSKDMLRALAVTHSHDVIHGDTKPANIMYDSRRDTYILTDFGAAYSDYRQQQSDKMIVGTPAYMSPEQLEGRKLDGRSDLFSLAVTLCHLLTGHQPFAGDNLPELKKNIVNHEPDLKHLTLPPGLVEVINKALQKKAYMRFADAQQMLTSIEFCESQLRGRMQQR